MEFFSDYPSIPIAENKSSEGQLMINLSELPGELFSARRGNVSHIIREDDIQQKQGITKGFALCGAQCEDDFMTVCEQYTCCKECLSWLNKWMDNSFYDEENGEWYSLCDEVELSKML